jgi:hypothetical protein
VGHASPSSESVTATREVLLIGIVLEKTAFGPSCSGPVQTAIPANARPPLEFPVAERC